MRSKDYRKQAWSALSGNWGIAILVGLVASFFGGTSIFGYFPTSMRLLRRFTEA